VQLHAVVHTHYTDCSSGNFRASSIQSWPCTKWLSLVSQLQEICGGHSLRSDKRQKTCRTGWKAWQQPLSTKAYERWSHDMTGALIYVAVMWSSSLM
jgi:hypothetical protein